MAATKQNWKIQAIAAGGLLLAAILLTLSFGKKERRRTLEDLESNLFETQQGYNFVKKRNIPKSDIPSVGKLRASITKLENELKSLSAESIQGLNNLVELNRIDQVDALMAQIVTSAGQHQLKITRIQTPDVPDEKKSDFFNVRENRMMEIQGGFTNLIYFLDDFSTLEYTVLVQSLIIEKVDLSNRLTIKIQLLL
jgi:hypothetical protein